MLIQVTAAATLLLALLLGWIQVQRMARHVAELHPEAGPLRLVGGGCGGVGHAPSPLAEKPVAKKPEGCEGCSNTSCKPGAAVEIKPLAN
ncbi:hypothetical protein M2323_002993 [Rhodoblastus acidophilus]|uniref:hypothetical protein n=1 Tax=Rhodoblastus acidophilus TaxID=1074 RepID=UPI0022244016|nr:hypothetical protein [Rhodoblastus acidophilus]MCW2285087.1 hypothetical protein [Rhodoblastus acidophilus]MCW2334055.1 hypothetical protein [Rhodoblastus acidophilus]